MYEFVYVLILCGNACVEPAVPRWNGAADPAGLYYDYRCIDGGRLSANAAFYGPEEVARHPDSERDDGWTVGLKKKVYRVKLFFLFFLRNTAGPFALVG